MNDEARVALGRVIHNYGPSICYTPQSAEMFVRRECSSYPDEARLLVEALRHGVTAQIVKYSPTDQPWDAFSGDLRHTLQSRAGLNELEGTWTVDTWARALGRHPEVWATPLAEEVQQPGTTVSVGMLKGLMLLIATGGGAAGGALGTIFVPGILLLTTATRNISMIQNHAAGVSKQAIWLVIVIVLLVYSAIGAVGGAIGAAAGWWHGGGDRNPWSAAIAAFGAAFTASALSSRFLGFIGAFFGSMIAAFGAARVAASRGE